jgi:purine-nucleoside phosphorylase
MPRAVDTAGAAVRVRCGARAPAAAIVLGTGLGGLVNHIECQTRIAYSDLPGVPRPSVPGHEGSLVHGLLNGREIVALAGRLHLYEGHSAETTVLPLRIAHAMGARVLVLSNAAGGIRPDLSPGTLMLIRDHLNLMWRAPSGGCDTYDTGLAASMRDAASATHTPLAEGVYAAVLGPSYETPAEIRMLATLGADAVGMSTVPEVAAARALGMRVVAISCITNFASGVSAERLSHADVLRATERTAPRFERLICRFVASLTPSG